MAEPVTVRDHIAGVCPSTELLTLEDFIDRPAWQRDALCSEPDYRDLPWFPERRESTAPARAVCARCLVRDECLAYALAHDITEGIWGGMTGRQRRRYATTGEIPAPPIDSRAVALPASPLEPPIKLDSMTDDDYRAAVVAWIGAAQLSSRS